jgi:flagellar FliL protein
MARAKPAPLAVPGRTNRLTPGLRAGLPVVLVTVLAIGAGAFWGMRVVGSVESTVLKRMEAATPQLSVNPAMAGSLVLKKLAPIVTNLAAPSNSWVRIEAALVMDQKAVLGAEPMVGAITEDILTFLRSVTARQIEGAAGLRNLREDLTERIAIRSKGLVRDIVIETVVVQ